jgi:D-glycerate 3-kinase
MHHHQVAAWLETRLSELSSPAFVGVSGAQGSGKSTLCANLEQTLGTRGISVVTLSIDDLYLTRAQRLDLGKAVHPLCAIRGLPGTHDVALGHTLFDELALAGPSTRTRIPRFDKSIDDRAQPEYFDEWLGRPDLVLFEGWCVGATAGAPWQGPINAREARDDPQGIWMTWSEQSLTEGYLSLWARLNLLILLEIPSFAAVVEGRCRQERALRQRLEMAGTVDTAVGLMSQSQVEDYVALFERKTRQMLAELPGKADLVIPAWQP